MKYLHGYQTYPINKLRISPLDPVALNQELRPVLNDFTKSYHWDRPHDGIGLQTPPTFSRRPTD
ncbi:MAG: hypothetical protein I8H75_06050 [Myxococcaceae bacterium]|nr:hypothetical protein [Myxococcaceae bacterium]